MSNTRSGAYDSAIAKIERLKQSEFPYAHIREGSCSWKKSSAISSTSLTS